MGPVASKESKYYPDFERDEVPSLNGKVVAITGCTSGTGLISAQCAARKGVKTILMLNRPSERAAAAEAAVKQHIPTGGTPTLVETIPCDLQDMASVQEAINIIKSKCDKIDVLCNNAGVMALEDVATKDGYDIQMQTNHLSHFLLTKELLPLIQKSTDGRIVNHSSIARKGGPLQAKYFEKNGGNLGGNGSSMMFNGARWERYHQTKLANSCFTVALAAKFEAAKISNVKAVCAAPGVSQTNLQVTAGSNGAMTPGFVMRMSQSAEDGTMPLLKAMFGEDTKNGDFYEPNGIGGLSGKVTKVRFDKHSTNKDQQKLLWEKSEEACGKFSIGF